MANGAGAPALPTLIGSTVDWTLTVLGDTPKTTEVLLGSFLDHVAGARRYGKACAWLAAVRPQNIGPTELMGEISAALDGALDELPKAIMRGLAYCLAELPGKEAAFERPDRLPLLRARREAQARENTSPADFVGHVVESWVLAQHVYWSVGRGLADARAQGKTLLRLKVMLDEGGWALAPGVSAGPPPQPTPDRLETVLTLATECGLL